MPENGKTISRRKLEEYFFVKIVWIGICLCICIRVYVVKQNHKQSRERNSLTLSTHTLPLE